MNTKRLISPLLLIVVFAACSLNVESKFTLAPESRLPKWFSLPPGKLKNEVTVNLTYFTGGDALFELLDASGKVLSKEKGRVCWHPETDKKRNKQGGFDPNLEPTYTYVRINGVLEVIEHRKGPIFRITDDPKLVKEAAKSTSCK